MQYRFITKSDNTRLLIIFAGWAMDANPFADLRRQGYDILVLWDYRDFSFDWSITYNYSEICVLAWSLGVYAASVVTGKIRDKITRCLAVNGTLSPVDSSCGIPESIFRGTLDGLNERNLEKFYRRVCGDRNTFGRFMSSVPVRPIDELRDELSVFLHLPENKGKSLLSWDVALVSSRDAIFPAENQINAWTGVAPVVKISGGHIPDFKAIIDRWIINKDLTGRRFSAGCSTYDRQASAQDYVVEKMARMIEHSDISEAMGRTGALTVEIGSGTGKLSRILDRFAGESAFLEMWDIVDNQPLSGKDRKFRVCDAEIAIRELPADSADVFVSASTVQWFNSPARFLGECARVLKKGGFLLIGTYADGNLSEVSEHTGRSLPLLSAQQWRNIIPGSLEIIEWSQTSVPCRFGSAIEVFRHLKHTGVNSLGQDDESGILRNALRTWKPDSDGQFTITYRPLIFSAVKK